MTRKPEGLPEFQKLIGKLVKVPKRELDRAIHKKKAKKRKK